MFLMMFLGILLVFSASQILATPELPLDVITNFFHLKDVESVTILSCASTREKGAILKEMSSLGFRVSFSETSTFTIDPHRLGCVLDLSCKGFEAFIVKMTKDRLTLSHHEWLLLDRVPVGNQDLQVDQPLLMPIPTAGLARIANTYLLPGSFATVAQLDGSWVHFYDVYRISMNNPLKYHHLASNSKEQAGYVLSKRPDRSDFENIILNAVTVIYKWDLFTTLDDPDRPDVDAWAKIHYPVAKHMEEQLNFKMNLSISDDYGWEVNGTFNGIMGYFQRGEAEIGGTALFMRADRMRLVDFTNVCFDLGSTIIFKQPRLSSVSNIFLLPFSKAVWLGIGVLALCVIIFLGLELILSRHLSAKPSYNEEYVGIIDIVTFVAGFICQQGSNVMPESLAARIAVFAFSLSVVFFYTSYAANIVALLRSTPPILKTLADLTASHLEIIVEDRKYTVIYFKESTDPNVHILYDKKVKPHLSTAFVTPKQGVAKMRTGEFAYNVDINAGYKWISDTFEEAEKCSLSEIKLFKTEMLAMPVAKRSGYKEIIAQKLCWQKETGLYDKVAATWIPPKPRCVGDSGGFTSVGIVDFLPAILALIYGSSIATLVLILELIYKHRDFFESFLCGTRNVKRRAKNNQLRRI